MNPYHARARSLYLRASMAWAAGYVADLGYPLSHYLDLTLQDARERCPEARGWRFVALARRVRRLAERDYEAPAVGPEWRQLEDDPQAWVLDTPARRRAQGGQGR